MSKRRRVPEDLMGAILSEGSGAPSEGLVLPEPRGDDGKTASSSPAGEGPLLWEEQPGRVGVTFNLSKQLAAELERLREELRPGEDARPSRSEIAEAALRIAVEDARERGEESEVSRRLGGRRVDHATPCADGDSEDGAGRTTRRSVDETGFIVETIYDGDGLVVDEDVVGSLSDLPVEEEFLDDEGRIVSRVRDESGNVFEQTVDDGGNTIAARVLEER